MVLTLCAGACASSRVRQDGDSEGLLKLKRDREAALALIVADADALSADQLAAGEQQNVATSSEFLAPSVKVCISALSRLCCLNAFLPFLVCRVHTLSTRPYDDLLSGSRCRRFSLLKRKAFDTHASKAQFCTGINLEGRRHGTSQGMFVMRPLFRKRLLSIRFVVEHSAFNLVLQKSCVALESKSGVHYLLWTVLLVI